jgi:hypothetical protein
LRVWIAKLGLGEDRGTKELLAALARRSTSEGSASAATASVASNS